LVISAKARNPKQLRIKSTEQSTVASKSKIAKAERKPKFSTRRENRCKFCGRPRSVYRKFGLCRICFRENANIGL